MANWKKLFKPWILERGEAYYEFDRILELEDDGDVTRAQVCGNRIYQVEIQRTGEHVKKMSCDCPHAAGGENCKHMAAVLTALEAKVAQPRIDWQTALAQMPEEQVRELVQNLAAEDETLQDRIVRIVSGPGNDPCRWQDELEQIISDHVDYRGWLDYDRAYGCMLEVVDYLEECLPSLLISGQVIDAAKLTMTVYGVAWGQDMDDSDGGLSVVSEHCREALSKILSLTDAQQEYEIFVLLHEFLDNGEWEYGSDDLEELILSLDWSGELQQKNLEWLDENLDSWRMRRRAEMMERMGASRAEMITWWEQYRENDDAYYPLLCLYEKEDLAKAIALVEDKRARENSLWGTTHYTETLIGLLEKAGEEKRCEAEIRYLVLELKCQKTEYVSRLKKITPTQHWPSVFERLLADAKRPVDRMQLYCLEGMLSELSAELSRYPYIDTFANYEETLRYWDHEQTLKLYTQILKAEMERACDRKQYGRIVAHLQKLEVYPDGREEAKALAAYWYIHHKNRPAMKDELRRAGYPQE